jgi:polar amino acid transport system permease protein
LSQAAGVVLGVFTALARLSRWVIPIARWVAGIYIWLFRGTPLLVQIVFVYYVVPEVTNYNVNLNEFWSAFIALALNEGAYMAEIVRAGITSVDTGQVEAAQSLGMRNWLTMRRIVLPQAIRFIIPPTGNEFISMLKNTSLAYVISTQELFFAGNQIGTHSFRYFEPLTIISLYYLAMTTVATIAQGFLERHYSRGFTREIRGPNLVQRAWAGALRRG